ncbi:uncharacterized protein KZ484_016073 isoform 2-T2 [Pholidichthys leucotaenia]
MGFICQRCEKLEHELHDRLKKMEMTYKQKLLAARLSEMEKYQEKIDMACSVSKMKEEIKSLKDSLTEMEAFYKSKLHESRSSLKQKTEELKSFKDRMAADLSASVMSTDKKRTNFPSKESVHEKKLKQKRMAPELRSSVVGTTKTSSSSPVRKSPTDKEQLYKEQLTELRTALAKKEEELKSFKDRLAAEVCVSIKTGNTESLNSPVSKSRLTEMYQEFKLLQWPKVKDLLKSHKMSSKFTKALIQKIFSDARDEMEGKKKKIEEVFDLQFSSEPPPQKVKEFRLLTVKNLQMSMYHSKDLLKNLFPQYEGEDPRDVMVTFRLLVSQCYWLGSLLALNSPPLQPDWQNHVPSMDAWDIFPGDIKGSTVK